MVNRWKFRILQDTQLAGAGTQTAGLAFGGQLFPPNAPTAITESYNGTAWTEVNDLNTARSRLAGSWNFNSSFSFWRKCS